MAAPQSAQYDLMIVADATGSMVRGRPNLD